MKKESKSAYHRRHSKKWYEAHSEEKRAYYKTKKETLRVYALKRRTGWTPERHAEALRTQHGMCAICQKPMGKIHSDHKHTTPPIPRALLCGRCNPGLGMFLNDPELLKRAAAYLQFWR